MKPNIYIGGEKVGRDDSSYMTGQAILMDGGHFSSVGTLLSLISPKE